MAKNQVTVKYVDDDGNNWAIWADKATIEVAGQGAKLGAAVTNGAYPPIPRWLKPRYAMFRGGTSDALRKVICYTDDCAAFTTAGTTLTMSTFRGTTVATETFTRAGAGYAENKRRKLVDDPTIS